MAHVEEMATFVTEALKKKHEKRRHYQEKLLVALWGLEHAALSGGDARPGTGVPRP